MYSLAITDQIMIKMVPFGRRHTENISLPLIELPTYNELAQNNWIVWFGFLQFMQATTPRICFCYEPVRVLIRYTLRIQR